MRRLAIYRNNALAGTLTENNRSSYVFKYDDAYFRDPNKSAISLTLPKSKQEYSSAFLFPVFFNMLSEGVNRQLQCRLWKIDEKDDFGLLSATARFDTIGALTVGPIAEP
jgi:HipA-like protein